MSVGEWGMKGNTDTVKRTRCVGFMRENEREARGNSVSVKRTTIAKEGQRKKERLPVCRDVCASEKTVQSDELLGHGQRE